MYCARKRGLEEAGPMPPRAGVAKARSSRYCNLHMSESIKPNLTQRDIEDGLRALGLSKGMAVEVHSSLSSFGHVVGGALAVIRGLMNVVGESGALIIPTFPMSPPLPLTKQEKMRGITLKIRIFSPDSDEKSAMGIIPDTFRKLPGVITGKGLHRVSSWGRNAEEHSKGFTHLIETDGWALLLGVDIHRLTSMHYREDALPDEIRSIFSPSEDILRDYPQDRWYVETGEPPVDAWGKIQTEADGRGLIRHYRIGNSECMLFRVRQVIDIYDHALKTDPFGLYELRDDTHEKQQDS